MTITTDKTEYSRGETVKITVRNNLTKSIWHYSPFWHLKEYEDKPGFQIPTDTTLEEGKEVCYLILYERYLGELKPNSEIHDEWDQKICPLGEGKGPFEPRPIEKGTYQLVFSYGVDKSIRDPYEVADPKTIYSNEFTIKEKSIANNCDSYQPPMTEEQIKSCKCSAGYTKFRGLAWAYCATDSQKTCKSAQDCPFGEKCISDDGKKWFCSGRKTGCYYWSPEDKGEVCAD